MTNYQSLRKYGRNNNHTFLGILLAGTQIGEAKNMGILIQLVI